MDNPLKPGDVCGLKGTDQNGKAFEGKPKFTKAKTQYGAVRQQLPHQQRLSNPHHQPRRLKYSAIISPTDKKLPQAKA